MWLSLFVAIIFVAVTNDHFVAAIVANIVVPLYGNLPVLFLTFKLLT